MPDSNLNTSISAMRTAILNDLPTATVAELVDLSRAAKSLNLANDSTVETAINDRAVALVSGGATQAEIIKISQAVKSVLSPATFANNIANITTITSSLVPDTDVAYDLGTSSNRFNDIYLDGNTIDLGGQTIKSTATGIEVPEITIGSGTNKVKLSANSSGKLEQIGTNSGGVVQDTVTGSGPASTAVTNLSDLTAISSPATGQSVLVTSTNKLYIYNGTGWYLIAEVTNLSPTAITGLNATYDLATDGTATTITLNSTDPEGATLTWSHAVTTGTLGSTATITNVDNVFTITPSTTQADAGAFSVTFSASDGSQAATSVSDFTLSFDWGTASHQQTLVPSIGTNTLYSNNAYARIGTSVAIDGDTLVVGGQGFSGQVWVFTRSGNTWTEQQELYASDHNNGDQFGISVDISGDTIIIGANKFQIQPAGNMPGAAYIFQRSGTTWTQEARLMMSSSINAASGEATPASGSTQLVYFGEDVAISGEDVIIGMYNYDLAATSGAFTNPQRTDIGGAVIFRRIDNPGWSTSDTGQDDWTIRKSIFKTAQTTAHEYARIGQYVDICNGVAAVSMNQYDGSVSNGGGIWIWTRDSDNISWTNRGVIYPSDISADDRVGRPDLDYSNGSYTLAVGVPHQDTGGTSAGAVYIFTSTNGTTWSQQQKIQASSTDASDRFGWSVSVSGDVLVVGAYGDDDTVTDAGAIYIFERSGTTWTQSKKLQAPTPEGSGTFGMAVAMDGDYVVVGAKDNPLTATLSGASYVYTK